MSLLRKLFGHPFDRVEEPMPLLRALGDGPPDVFGVRASLPRPHFLRGKADPQAMADLKAILALDASAVKAADSRLAIGDPAALGQKVREHRLSRKLSQAELARAASVGTRFVGELERGKATLEIGKVIHVVAACGMTLVLE